MTWLRSSICCFAILSVVSAPVLAATATGAATAEVVAMETVSAEQTADGVSKQTEQTADGVVVHYE